MCIHGKYKRETLYCTDANKDGSTTAKRNTNTKIFFTIYLREISILTSYILFVDVVQSQKKTNNNNNNKDGRVEKK